MFIPTFLSCKDLIFLGIKYMVLVPERIVQTLQVKFGLRDTQDMIKMFLFAAPFQPGLLKFLIRSVLEGGPKFAKK